MTIEREESLDVDYSAEYTKDKNPQENIPYNPKNELDEESLQPLPEIEESEQIPTPESKSEDNIFNNSNFKSVNNLEFDFKEISWSDSATSKNNASPYSIESVADYLAKITKLKVVPGKGTEYAYRGSSDMKYELQPSLFRDNNLNYEKEYYHHAIRLSPEEFLNRSYFDMYCKMQHYGIPTRLLDFTTNPLVALWFACDENNKTKQVDGKVEIIHGEFYRADIHEIQLLCSIGDFMSTELDENGSYFNLERFHDYLLKKNLWCGGEDWNTYLQELAKLEFVGVRPDYSNPRLKFQQGLFILFGLNSLGNIGSQPRLEYGFRITGTTITNRNIITLRIRKEKKSSIKKDLQRIGFDISRIYPEIEHISEYIKQIVTIDNTMEVES